jgi:Concanavalin A-like lectin/glucanases superfamily/Divergent InlB B-repeat domain/Immunoglobulin I-set domain
MSAPNLQYLHDSSGNLAIRAAANAVPPKILGQPFKQIVTPGEIVTFSVVVADASAVTFQWKFNGTDIPGATGDSLLLPNVNAANLGQYSVTVTNSAGSVTSTPAELLLDTDDDGLPDTWEAANFIDPDATHPLNPANQRSETDPDKDGVSNLDEFLDGTNPTDKASLRPRLGVYSVAGGSVMIDPMKLSYDVGETVMLTAVPFPSSVFMGWTKDLIGNANPIALTMDKNKTARARFASAASLPPGLIALWRGETDASDLIGGHHGEFLVGTEIIAPSLTGSGKVGGAFNFDGTQHVRVPDSASLRPAQFTAEAWVFPTAAPNNIPQTIIARGHFGNTWDLRLTNSMPQFWSHGAQGLVGSSAIPLNEWTHLAITFDGFIKRLYVNGAQVASREQLRALLYDASVPVTIGSDFEDGKSGNHFHGRIDEVALYNRALTADEVLSMYNADFLGKNFSQPYFTSPSQLPDGVLGTNYTQQLATILGTPPISFSLMEGLLPIGMTLSSDGLVSGVPGVLGTFVFSAGAKDAAGQVVEQLCIFQVF